MSKISGKLESVTLPLAWVIVIILFVFLRPGSFATWGNVTSLLSSQAVLMIVALAVLPPLTSGDFDLSVGSVVGMSAMLIALLNTKAQLPILLAIFIALAASVLVGVLNAWLCVKMGLDTLIVTLGTGTFVVGVAAMVSNMQMLSGIDNGFVRVVIGLKLAGIPLVFYYGIAIALIVWYVLAYTPVGRRALMMGQNRAVARLNGVRVDRIRTGSLIASAGIASMLYAGISGAAAPGSGSELLPAYAAVFRGKLAAAAASGDWSEADVDRSWTLHRNASASMFGLEHGPMDEWDILPRLPQVTAPALFIGSAEDNGTPFYHSEEMHAALPGSELAVISPSGHFSFAEQPEQFRAAVTGFMERSGLPGADTDQALLDRSTR